MTWLVDADVKEPVIETGVNASGGTESVININGQSYRLHTFTSTDELLVFSGGMVEVLVVGAGGGGGELPESADLGSGFISIASSGGGGAGGVVNCNLEVFGGGGFLGEYDITVGPTSNVGQSGGDSAIIASGVDQVRAKGGGRGGNVTLIASGNAVDDGQDGGSSGGGAVIAGLLSLGGSPIYADQTSNAGNRVFGQGNNGSDAFVIAGLFTGDAKVVAGAGGGASKPATTANLNAPNNGGDGIGSTITGAFKYYAGGGNAYNQGNVFGVGGVGGGGNILGISGLGSDGVNQLGGGGAGGQAVQSGVDYFIPSPSGKGGSGIVIIRYPIGV